MNPANHLAEPSTEQAAGQSLAPFLPIQTTLSTSLQLIDRDPGVGREPLDHGEEELEAARPVRQQRHEQRQLEHGGHVHVVDLRPLKERVALVVVARGRALTCSSLMATHELEGKPWWW